ncbi:potassium channel family protein [Virgibacillus sp. YIM 98842]|uniref:potassium channel family protein n=1 Tax=Virgibacillus sp. YIM 98842 TaxID=2663533 RepID=UPI0013DD57C9|nr:potassium channel family protein [Virgibacillus sp. YIM 98842]
MFIIPWLILGGIAFIVIKSLIDFIRGGRFRTEMRDAGFSLDLFYSLVIIFIIVITGFGLIYFILSFQGIILVEHGELRQVSVLGTLIHSLYFSGVTMLTIGYGDITPIGIGRLIAVLQALIGYILPTAFVLRLVQRGQRSRNE